MKTSYLHVYLVPTCLLSFRKNSHLHVYLVYTFIQYHGVFVFYEILTFFKAATTAVLCLNHYLNIVTTSMKKRWMSRFLLIFLKIFLWLSLGLQIFTTIATRNHYTVDIWLAALFSYMNWIWHCHVILKRDPVVGNLKRPNIQKFIFFQFLVCLKVS